MSRIVSRETRIVSFFSLLLLSFSSFFFLSTPRVAYVSHVNYLEMVCAVRAP